MRSSTPTIHCDGEDGFCEFWDVDYYEATASTVNGIRITKETRAPGWVSTDYTDLCPQHAHAAELQQRLDAGESEMTTADYLEKAIERGGAQ